MAPEVDPRQMNTEKYDMQDMAAFNPHRFIKDRLYGNMRDININLYFHSDIFCMQNENHLAFIMIG